MISSYTLRELKHELGLTDYIGHLLTCSLAELCHNQSNAAEMPDQKKHTAFSRHKLPVSVPTGVKKRPPQGFKETNASSSLTSIET